MQRPEVRVIENQYEETKQIEVSVWEQKQLLAKYGYIDNTPSESTPMGFNPTSDLSYEELMRLEDQKHQRELETKMLEYRMRPKTYSIDSDQVRYNQSRWADLEGTNLGVEVTIVSDMKINGYRY